MSWLLSIFIGALTALAGAFVAGVIASASVSWYRISSFEGGSGYFVVAMIILGLAAGLVIGVVGARIVAAGPSPGFLKAAGLSLGVVAGLGAMIGGVARLLADVPPTVGGQELHVMVEVRWPEGQTPPAADSVGSRLGLGSVNASRVRRVGTEGPLWLEDARLEEGRWIVPGAVELFTERGKRVIDIQLGDSSLAGFLLPIPRRPGRKHFEWTPWYPTPRSGEPWPADKFSVRYRIMPRDQPVRTQTVGDFEVATVASGFVRDEHGMGANAEFAIGYRSRAVEFPAGQQRDGSEAAPARLADGVAVVAGDVPGLMVVARDISRASHCYLVVPAGDSLRIERVGECGYRIDADLLTVDSAAFRAHLARRRVPGEIDRVTFRQPARYHLGRAVVDTRELTVRPLPAFPSEITELQHVPPLSLSPDGRTLVRFIYQGYSSSTAALLAINVVAGTTTMLPVDRDRMRYGELSDLDPDWVNHHFRWARGADGVDRLEVREGFKPLPYRGRLTHEGGGHYYALKPAGEPLAKAVVEFLVAEFGGTPLPRGEYITWDKVRIGERTVSIMATGSSADAYVLVSLETGETDPELIPDVARRFDQALASGKYDSLFRTSDP